MSKMRNKVFLLSTLFIALNSTGQHIGIDTFAHSQVVVYIPSKGGLLIPRLTTQQRNSIPNPANNLIIFNISTFCLELFDSLSSSWMPLLCKVPCDTGFIISHAGAPVPGRVGIGTKHPHPSAVMEIKDTVRGILLPHRKVLSSWSANVPAGSIGITDSGVVVAYNNGIHYLGKISPCRYKVHIAPPSTPTSVVKGVQIGNVQLRPSTILAIDSTNMFKLPSFTTTQMSNLHSPAHGLLLWNSTENCLLAYDSLSGKWFRIGCPAMCMNQLNVIGPDTICVRDTVSWYVNHGTCSDTLNYTDWMIPTVWIQLSGGDTLTAISPTIGQFYIRAWQCLFCGQDTSSPFLVMAIDTPDIPNISVLNPMPTYCKGSDTVKLILSSSFADTFIIAHVGNWQVNVLSDTQVAIIPMVDTAFQICIYAKNKCGISTVPVCKTFKADTIPVATLQLLVGDTCKSSIFKWVLNISNGARIDSILWKYPPDWLGVEIGGDTFSAIVTTPDTLVAIVCNNCGCDSIFYSVSSLKVCRFCIYSFTGTPTYDNLDDAYTCGTASKQSGLLVAGYMNKTTSCLTGQNYITVAYYDLAGNLVKGFKYQIPGEEVRPFKIFELPSGNWIMIGHSNAAKYVIKGDKYGNILGIKQIEVPLWDHRNLTDAIYDSLRGKVVISFIGGDWFAGTVYDLNIIIIDTSLSSAIGWCIKDVNGKDENIGGIALSPDGNYLVSVNYYEGYGGNYWGLLLKIDANTGNVLWSRGYNPNNDVFYYPKVTVVNNSAFLGGNGGPLLKIDALSGAFLGGITFSVPSVSSCNFVNVISMSSSINGNIYVLGGCYGKAVLLVFDTNLTFLKAHYISDYLAGPPYHTILDIAALNDSSVALIGSHTPGGGCNNFETFSWIGKLDSQNSTCCFNNPVNASISNRNSVAGVSWAFKTFTVNLTNGTINFIGNMNPIPPSCH